MVKETPVKFPVGTRVEIGFGPALPCDLGCPLLGARRLPPVAHRVDLRGSVKSMVVDVPAFHELLDASGDLPVRELISNLDGCTGGKAGEIVATAGLNRACCSNITRAKAEKLLLAARENAKPVNPKRLGAVGPEMFSQHAYACARGMVQIGSAEPKGGNPLHRRSVGEGDTGQNGPARRA